MSWTLDQLETLEAIEATGSFAAAARKLGRVTSAVSYQIKTLEQSLGLVLFDRSGHRATLTQPGRVILDEARAVLARSRGLTQVAQQLGQGWEPVLKVVVEGIVPQPPVMRALRRFGQRGLPTRVRMKVEYLTGVEEQFVNSGADLMILLGGQERWATVTLPEIEMLLLAHRDHPVHRPEGPPDRETLGTWVELTVADSGSQPRPKPQEFSLGGPQLLELSDFYSKRQALLGGVGFGWLPRHLAQGHMEALRLVDFEEGSRVRLQPRLAHRRGQVLGRSAQLFASLLMEEVAAAPLPAPEG